MKRPFATWGIGVLTGILLSTLAVVSMAQTLPDAVTADPKHFSVEFENDIVHAPTNVGKALAESIVVEFKNRQRAR